MGRGGHPRAAPRRARRGGPRAGDRQLKSASRPRSLRARRLRAVLFDLDGTLTRPRSSWQWIHERLGLWSGRAARHQDRFIGGQISYEEFCRLDAAEWAGMSEASLRAICDAIPYHPGAAETLGALKSAGLLVGIVSTGLSLLADRVRAEHALDHAASNVLVMRDGAFTGEVRIVIAHGEKDRALRSFCSEFELEPAEVAAVGDTEGDVSMFRAAGWSVAFNAADPSIERAASAVAPGIDLRSVLPLIL